MRGDRIGERGAATGADCRKCRCRERGSRDVPHGPFLSRWDRNERNRFEPEPTHYAISLAALRWRGGESGVDVRLDEGVGGAWRRGYAQWED